MSRGGLRLGIGLRQVVRPAARGAASLVLAAAGLAAAAAPASAATITFGIPTAQSTYGQGIDFRQPESAASGVERVEIVIDYPGATGPAATEVQPDNSPAFSYHLDTSKGQLVPNTTLAARWRVTFDDGTEQTGPEVRVTYVDDRFSWHTKSGKYVRLHWYQGDDAFANAAISVGDQGVEKAAALFGATETKPIDFFVYSTQAAFLQALGPGTPEDVGGQAHSDIRTLFALITPGDIGTSWVSTVVPHELTHIVFADAVDNPYHFPPHWLNEGLAVYLSVGYGSADRGRVQSAAQAGSLMPLQALSASFPTPDDRFRLGYAEAVSAVDYLVRTFGKPALVKLVQTYARGVSDDEAFRAGIGLDVAAFDKRWMAASGQASAQAYGPQPAPPGPLPPGWTVASAAPGSTRTPAANVASGAPPSGGSAPSSASSRGFGRRDGSEELLVTIVLLLLASLLLVVAVAVNRSARRAPGPRP